MTTVRIQGELVRRFVVANLDKHPSDIVKIVMARFELSRQAVHKHLHRLVDDGSIVIEGERKKKIYRLAPLIQWTKRFLLVPGVAEDQVWREDVAPSLALLPANALEIWQHGFTEMFNNAIDHSGGTFVSVIFAKTAASTTISLLDDGIGIFKKIQAALSLADERHAVLELAKGKFTTDPANHSGEGIFFSSRMFDRFAILSGGVYFSLEFGAEEDWILQRNPTTGTYVTMTLNNHTARTARKVFSQFTSGDDFGFNKTIVPVNLATYGDDNLISRSQAKRLLSRIDRFKVVIFDFSDVGTIGQAFADEVFRVFARNHPKIEITAIKASAEVKQMISRAKASSQ